MKIFNCSLICGILLLLESCRSKISNHYPAGTVLKEISWQVPLQDSINILKKKNGIWLLPEIKDSDTYKKSYSYFRKPSNIKYKKQLGKINQEEINSSDSSIVRLYRFSYKGIMLVGYTSTDDQKLLTIFDPPVIIRPANLNRKLTSYSLMKTWSKNKFDKGLKTTVTIKPKGTGYFLNDSGQIEKGELYKLTIARNATVQYGIHNLILPDAITMSSNILADKNGNLVLEWGIRAKPPKDKYKERHRMPDSLFIEVTEYKRIK